MCCPLDHPAGRVSVRFEKVQQNHVMRCIYNMTPETCAARASRCFQRIELLEKIAELVDEICHLLGSQFQRYVRLSKPLFQCHDTAHSIEHVLHSFCFLGDLSRLWADQFFIYHHHHQHENIKCDALKKIDWKHSAARVCHAIAHLISTVHFLNGLRLSPIARLEKLGKCAPFFSVAGFAIQIFLTLRQQRIKTHKKHSLWSSNFTIQLTGLLFETGHCLQAIWKTSHASFGKMTALSGVVHAWSVIQRLLPEDVICFKTNVTLPSTIQEAE